jgi:hypothetical protein
MRESQIEKHLTKRVKALGGEVRKVSWIGRAGAPDRLVLLKGPPSPTLYDMVESAGPQTTLASAMHPFVELKAPGKVAEPHQAREHKRLRAAGFIVLVLDSIEAIDEVFY